MQPRPGARFDWDAKGSGGFSVRAQVRAIHEAGFDPIVTFYSTPAWAARPAGGCEPPKANVNARAPRADALPDYRAMVESFLAMARKEGLDVRHLSAWNEPNSGLFLAPQRERCDPASSPSRGAAQYAPIARALSAALDAAPGDQEAVVGEISSPFQARPIISTVDEFVAALPRDVACGGRVWAQHQYVGDADGVVPGRAAPRRDSLRAARAVGHRDRGRRPQAGGAAHVRRDHAARRLRRPRHPPAPLVGRP